MIFGKGGKKKNTHKKHELFFCFVFVSRKTNKVKTKEKSWFLTQENNTHTALWINRNTLYNSRDGQIVLCFFFLQKCKFLFQSSTTEMFFLHTFCLVLLELASTELVGCSKTKASFFEEKETNTGYNNNFLWGKKRNWEEIITKDYDIMWGIIGWGWLFGVEGSGLGIKIDRQHV